MSDSRKAIPSTTVSSPSSRLSMRLSIRPSASVQDISVAEQEVPGSGSARSLSGPQSPIKLSRKLKTVAKKEGINTGELRTAESLASVADYTGWLTKRGEHGMLRNWKKRFVMLAGQVLYYYENETSAAPKGIVFLDGASISFSKQPQFKNNPDCLVVVSKSGRAFYFQSEDPQYTLSWYMKIKEVPGVQCVDFGTTVVHVHGEADNMSTRSRSGSLEDDEPSIISSPMVIDMNNEINTLTAQVEILRSNVTDLEQEKRSLLDQVAASKNRVQVLETEKVSYAQEKITLEGERSKWGAERLKLEAELRKVSEDKSALEKEKNSLQESLQRKTDEIDSLLQAQSQAVSSINKESEMFQQELTTLQTALKKSETTVLNLEKTCESYRSEIEALKKEKESVDDVKALAEQLENDLLTWEKKHQTAVSETKYWKDKHEKSLSSLTDKESAISNQITELESNIMTLSTELDKSKQQAQELEEALNSAKSSIEKMTAEAAASQVQVAELQEELRRAQEESEAMKAASYTELQDALAKVEALSEVEAKLTSELLASKEESRVKDTDNAVLQEQLAEKVNALEEATAYQEDLQSTVDTSIARIELLGSQLAAAQELEQKAQTDIKALMSEVEALSAQIASLNSDTSSSKKLVVTLECERMEKEIQIGQMQQEIDELASAKKQLEDQNGQLQQEIESLNASKQQSEVQDGQLQQEIESLTVAKKQLEEQTSVQQEKITKFELEVATLNATLVDVQKRLEVTSSELGAEATRWKEQVVELEGRNESLLKEISEAAAEHGAHVKELEAQAVTVQTELKELKEQYERQTTDLAREGESLRKDKEELAQALSEANARLEDSEKTKEVCEQRMVAMEKDMQAIQEQYDALGEKYLVIKKGYDSHVAELEEEIVAVTRKLEYARDDLRIAEEKLEQTRHELVVSQEKERVLTSTGKTSVKALDEEKIRMQKHINSLTDNVQSLMTQIERRSREKELLEAMVETQKETIAELESKSNKAVHREVVIRTDIVEDEKKSYVEKIAELNEVIESMEAELQEADELEKVRKANLDAWRDALLDLCESAVDGKIAAEALRRIAEGRA